MVLVHEPVEGEAIGAQLPARESRGLAIALVGLINRLHKADVRGISLRVGELRQSEGRFRLDGFEHLCGAGTEAQDLDGLISLLRRVAGHHIGMILDPPPRTAAAGQRNCWP